MNFRMGNKRSPMQRSNPGTFEYDDTISQYLKTISQTSLLSLEEEAELGKAMVAGRRARRRLERARKNSTERGRLIDLVTAGEQARKKLIQANSRLVVSIAKRYRRQGVPFSDLIQEGNIGLMRAVDKYDHTRGFRFSTYATWWIRQSVTRAIADQGRMIRLPVHASEKVTRMAGVAQHLEQELGRKPTSEELAQELGTSAVKIDTLRQRSQLPLSLEMTIGEDGDSTLTDLIPSDAVPSPTETVTRRLLSEDVRQAMSVLSPREQEILSLRFGFNDGHARTLDEIGDELGYTRERIRQIEKQALAKLRKPQLTEKLHTYLEN